jgi:PAS domain S-box-containing protein
MVGGGDSTERERAQEALRQGEQRLELALADCEMATVDADLTTGALACSPRLYDIYGYAPGDLAMPSTFEEFFTSVHPDDAERVREAVTLALSTDAPFDVECRVQRASGDYVWIHERARRFIEPDGTAHVRGVVMDLTARKRADQEWARLEAQLRNAHGMDSFGAVAGGIAHDFNNLLGPMLGNAQLLVRAFEPSDSRHGLADDIVQAALKARDLVRRIILFTRSNGEEPLLPADGVAEAPSPLHDVEGIPPVDVRSARY